MSLPLDPPPLEALLGRGRATVGELFLARAERSAERPFLLFAGRTWSYGEARQEAERFAGWLLSRPSGGSAGLRVASFLPNRPEAIWALLGSTLAGAVYVPLNRAHRGPVLGDMIARAGAQVMITDLEGLELLPDLSATAVDAVLVVDGEPGPDSDFARRRSWQEVESSTPGAAPVSDPSALAEVLYTSGTTGRSKAVLLPHNYLVRNSSWVAWSLDLGEDDVIHAWLPLFHIAGQMDTVLCFIAAGGVVALQPTFSRSRFWDQVEGCGATCFIGFSNVIELIWGIERRESDAATSLRIGMVGGIPPKLHRDFEARFDVRLHDIYGMTEAEPLAFRHPGTEPPVGAAGQANPDFELAILGPRDERLPAGSEGQIAFRPRVPDVMLKGYEHDEAAFVEATRSLWFHTGDLGKLDDDGNLYFKDRAKHAIRRRGENISSFELERVLIGHERIAEAAAVGVPSPLGEDDVKVIVVPEQGAALDPVELWEWCQEQMAAFMVPRYIEISERLPRGPTGKVQKEELTQVSADLFDAERDRGKSRSATGAGR
ncbi:MAG: AMP-binding protein [Actinobacteria bacterium]|nr:AMP-binding protein [Actinomycetota bacterium]